MEKKTYKKRQILGDINCALLGIERASIVVLIVIIIGELL